MAEGNVAALADSGKNEIINLAGPKFVTLNQIAEELKEILGDISVKHEPARPHDFEGSVTSIDKAKKLLNWLPETQFEEGLRKYVNHVKKADSEQSLE